MNAENRDRNVMPNIVDKELLYLAMRCQLQPPM